MNGNKFLLDTNVVIEVFDGNKSIADKINELSEFYISSIVLGELYIGINRVINKTKHLQKLEDFLKLCSLLDVNSVTAKHYGNIVASLYKKGKPIPTNDVWIAATSIQYNTTLVTRDKHFYEIDNLVIENW